MKGTILKCLKDMVVEKSGKETWERILEKAGINKNLTSMFFPTADVNDTDAIKLFTTTCQELNISMAEASDTYGDYWVNVYSPKMYNIYMVKHKTAKDFLLDMDNLHVMVTKTMSNSQPPRFKYEWENDNTLIMHYESHRNLVDLLAGLAKGVGKYFKTDLKVTKLDNKKVQILFP